MKRYIPVLLAALAFMVLCTSVNAKDASIVYLDSQRILIESAAGKDAYDKLEAIKNEKQVELDKMLNSLKELGNTISVQAPTMNASARQELEFKYEQEQKNYNRYVKDAQEELRRKELSLVKPISDEVNVIIEDYAGKNGIDIILDKRNPGIVYTSEDLDITDAILELYNKKYQGSKGKKE